MANFCINCGSKLEEHYNFCINCGTKIDKSYMKQHNPSSNQYSDSMEKKKAKQKLNRVVGGIFDHNFRKTLGFNGSDYIKVKQAIILQVGREIDSGQIKSGGVEYRVNQLIGEYKIKMEREKEAEKEEERKKLKIIDEIFESAEIKSQIRKNQIDSVYITLIKHKLNDKLINKKENMSEEEIKHFIKTELEKARMEQERARMEKEKVRQEQKKARMEQERARVEKGNGVKSNQKRGNERKRGGYCDLSCIHCYEEFLDNEGAIVGDFSEVGYTEHYCALGHYIPYGSFCEYYE